MKGVCVCKMRSQYYNAIKEANKLCCVTTHALERTEIDISEQFLSAHLFRCEKKLLSFQST